MDSKRDIVITRVFDAPVELVWKAWTDPHQVVRWWGPADFTSPSAEIDLHEGGGFTFCMRAPQEMGGMDMYTAGVYTRIVPFELIQFTQHLSDKDGNKIDPTLLGMPAEFPPEVYSELRFRRLGEKTELTAIEYGWTSDQLLEMSQLGLEQCLDKLAGTLVVP